MYFPLNKPCFLLNVCLSVKPRRSCKSHRQMETIGILCSTLQPARASFVKKSSERFQGGFLGKPCLRRAGLTGAFCLLCRHTPLGFNVLFPHKLIFKVAFRATCSKSQSQCSPPPAPHSAPLSYHLTNTDCHQHFNSDSKCIPVDV